MVEIDKLTKHYGKHPVLKSISLRFDPGQSVAIIGPNGSGKTTLLKAILGLVLPDSGTIRVSGYNVAEGCTYRNEIGYMPQINRFPEHMRVSQLFAMIKTMRARIPLRGYDEELYEGFAIEAMNKKPLGALSGGMRQQVSAALAFLFDPSVIILDEPTAALDPVSNELLKDKINRSIYTGKLVLVTSHILSDLDEIANQIVYLMEGNVIFFRSLADLREQTSETRLNKMMVQLINGAAYAES